MLEIQAAPTVTRKPPAIVSLIGDTPLVEVTQLDTGSCQLFLKLENQNPTGSIKDRIALSMIEAAEREGKLEPGGTVIEATAGNTGLGLALVAGAKGYRVVLVIPDKMSQEKISHVRALGAEVRLTRSDVTRGHPEYYQDVAARLPEEIPGVFMSINLAIRRTRWRMSAPPVRRFGNKCGTMSMRSWSALARAEPSPGWAAFLTG